MVHALAGQDLPSVEAGGIAAKVPFADHAGVVAGGLKQLRHRSLRAVEAVEDGDSVPVGVCAGQHGGPARRADGVRDEGVPEEHSLPGEAVEVRGLVDARAVGGDRVSGVVVRHDEDDVGAEGGRGRGADGEKGGGEGRHHGFRAYYDNA